MTRFRNAHGAIYLGTLRLSPELAEGLSSLFEREAIRSNDWTLFDDLHAAFDEFGVVSSEIP